MFRRIVRRGEAAMHVLVSRGLIAVGIAVVLGVVPAAGQGPKDAPKEPAKAAAKDTPAAEFTRTKLLKAKVTGSFTDARLGDILKEFAAQVEVKTDEPVMWAYGTGLPFDRKVTFAVKNESL